MIKPGSELSNDPLSMEIQICPCDGLLIARDPSPLWFTGGSFGRVAANFPNQSCILPRNIKAMILYVPDT